MGVSSSTSHHGDAWIPEETLEHLRTARREVRASMEALLPPAFVEHRRSARRAALLAARSWIDHLLTKTGETPRA